MSIRASGVFKSGVPEILPTRLFIVLIYKGFGLIINLHTIFQINTGDLLQSVGNQRFFLQIFGGFYPNEKRLAGPVGAHLVGGGAMLKLRLDQLRPGMKLGQDVVNFSGQVLLYQGNPVQPKDIKNFKAWGILEVTVENTSMDPSDSFENNRIDAKLLVEAQSEISNLFRHSNLSHPVISELMRLSTLNKLKQKPGMENVNVY